MIARIAFALARLGANLFFLATWAYGITTYSPFAFDMFVRPQLFSPLATFVTWHHAFYWIAFAASAATLVPDIVHPQRIAARRAAVGYLLVLAGVGLYLLGDPYLVRLDSSSPAPWMVYGALLPIGWLAVIDHLSTSVGAPPRRSQAPTSQLQLFWACSATGVVLWIAHVVAAAANGRLLQGAGSTATLAWALVLDVAGLWLVYAVGTFIAALASTTQRRFASEFYLAVAASALGIMELWRRLVLPAFSFAAADATLIAVAIGVALAASWSGLRARSSRESTRSTLDSLLALPLPSRAFAAPAIVAICAIAATLTTTIERIDWANLLHATIAIIEAALILGIFMALFRRGTEPVWPWRIAVAPPLLAVIVVHAFPFVQTRLAAATGDAQLEPRVVIDRLASADPLAAFVAERLLALPAFDLDYFEELLASENSQMSIAPELPATAAPTATPVAALPNVFVFVIDSLRRDYLSPYNPAVTFTPAIDAWARDSFVFNNAFTPYGGTWLAMPSLWVGAPVTRGWGRIFGRMNALEAGITAAGYDFVINDFTVADQLRPTTRRTFLDPSIPSKDTDLCRNVDALKAHLTTRQSSAPLFTFLAPMNVHILNTGIKPGATPGNYPGFYQSYASRLARLDSCFGALIDDLKRRGIYDTSLIVLTSDHGDALGEEGRWGHQYHLFPETIRIPLIVHLPRQSRSAVTTDLSRISMLTDITPTVLEAIGQPFPAHAASGASLFVPADDEPPQRRRDSYLLMSSYGSTYGVLRRNGRQLYITDLRNWREYAIALDGEPLGRPVPVTGATRRVNQQKIREKVAAVQDLYQR